VSLSVGFLAVLLSVTIGVAVGTVSALARGPIGIALVAATDFALAVPRVVLLLLLAALWSPSVTLVILVLGLTGWMPVARLVFAEARALLGRPFVEAAQALGSSRRRLLLRHLVPNVATPVIVAAALGVGNAILLEAGLSFLGMGVQPPAPSWGNMIASGRDALMNAPWVAIAPGVLSSWWWSPVPSSGTPSKIAWPAVRPCDQRPGPGIVIAEPVVADLRQGHLSPPRTASRRIPVESSCRALGLGRSPRRPGLTGSGPLHRVARKSLLVTMS
jgi:hypothetical protein